MIAIRLGLIRISAVASFHGFDHMETAVIGQRDVNMLRRNADRDWPTCCGAQARWERSPPVSRRGSEGASSARGRCSRARVIGFICRYVLSDLGARFRCAAWESCDSVAAVGTCGCM